MIDKELKTICRILSTNGIRTLASCSGHGKYPMTIVAEINGHNYELFSGKHIPRKRRFYFKDDDGNYYIPEVLESKNE